QSLSGDFAFERLVDNNATPIVRVAAANANFALGNGTTTFVALTGGQGSFVLAQAGIAGQLSGTVSVTIPGVAVQGTLAVQVNQTGQAVNQSFGVGGTTVTLNLPAGPFLRFAATGLNVAILGQTLSGDFAFEQATDAATNQTVIRVSVANLNVSLGGGVVSVSNGQANFVLTSAGIAGQGSGAVAGNRPGSPPRPN